MYKRLRAFVQIQGKMHVFNVVISYNWVMKYRTTNLCICTTATAAISNRCGHAMADINVWSSETRGPWRYAAKSQIAVIVCTNTGVFPTNLCCKRKHMQCSMHAYWRWLVLGSMATRDACVPRWRMSSQNSSTYWGRWKITGIYFMHNTSATRHVHGISYPNSVVPRASNSTRQTRPVYITSWGMDDLCIACEKTTLMEAVNQRLTPLRTSQLAIWSVFQDKEMFCIWQ